MGQTESSHSSAIGTTSRIGEGTRIGRFCVIGDEVTIGSGCEIGHHVVIHDGSTIGNNVRIDEFTTIGKLPMKAHNSAVTRNNRPPPAAIGDGCLIGAHVVVYAGCTIEEKVLVADMCTLREEVRIGAYSIVGRGVAIENQCKIGRYCKLETNAYLTAYSVVEDRVFIAPGVLTSNDNFLGRTEERFKHFQGVTIRRGGRLGVGAVILPGKTVAPDAVVAAGAVLTKDAEEGIIYGGVPARPLRAVPPDQLLDRQGWKDA